LGAEMNWLVGTIPMATLIVSQEEWVIIPKCTNGRIPYFGDASETMKEYGCRLCAFPF